MNAHSVTALIGAAHEGFIVISAEGHILEWNAEAERMFGWSKEEALGRDVAATIIPQRYRAAHRSAVRRFLESGKGPGIGRRLELEAVHRDGRELPVEMTIAAVEAPGGWHFGAFVRDISGRQRAARYREAQLALSRVLAEAGAGDSMLPVLQAIGSGMGWDGSWGNTGRSTRPLGCFGAGRPGRRMTRSWTSSSAPTRTCSYRAGRACRARHGPARNLRGRSGRIRLWRGLAAAPRTRTGSRPQLRFR